MEEQVLNTVKIFKEEITNILKRKILDIIIFGSSVRGDFIEGKGDIDFLVFLNKKLTKEETDLLINLHHEYRQKTTLFKQLEGCYYNIDVNYNVTKGLYVGTNENNWREVNTLLSNHIESAFIRDAYLSLNETHLVENIFSIHWDLVKKDITDQMEYFMNDISNSNDVSYLLYLVKTSARSLYTLKKQKFISKNKALEWLASMKKYSITHGDMLQVCLEYNNPLTSTEKRKIGKRVFSSLDIFLSQINRDIMKLPQ